MESKLNLFKSQIDEDIQLLKLRFNYDSNILKDEYTFNYWVLTKMYNLDDEIAKDCVTEYNDKWIDCFVHFPDTKELFIIQNKYYDENTSLSRKELSDFLISPISALNSNEYRNKSLQKVYNDVKDDNEYNIFLHFYITNLKKQDYYNDLIWEFRKNNSKFEANIFFLDDIYEKYYWESYINKKSMSWDITTRYEKNCLKILPEDYHLPNMKEAYYIMAPIIDLYNLYKESKKVWYQLFEKNIREYLWNSSVNKWIMATLTDKQDRDNFFYYNNWITIIADSVDRKSWTKYTLNNPQIVNWCQSVNSIYYVLDSYSEVDIKADFKDVFVMCKILVVDKDNSIDDRFAKDVVKYTNKQNAINEKVFGAILDPFIKIQEWLKDRGWLLLVKPSDKNIFKTRYKDDKKALFDLFEIANKNNLFNIEINKVTDLFIPIDKLLQIIWAVVNDWYFAYTKKNKLLDPREGNKIYENFSRKINECITINNMLKLYSFYKHADIEQWNSQDKKTPIPYYVLSFLWYWIKKNNNLTINSFLDSVNYEDFVFIYDYTKGMSSQYVNSYYSKYSLPYNEMIKKEIDNGIIDDIISNYSIYAHEKDDRMKKIFWLN